MQKVPNRSHETWHEGWLKSLEQSLHRQSGEIERLKGGVYIYMYIYAGLGECDEERGRG